MEETLVKEVKRRGRPPLVNPCAENSYAKTGIIRKPIYLQKKEQSESQASAVAISLNSPSFFAASQRDAPVARKFISVEAFTPRGPKPGQKRKPYKKRKQKKKPQDELMKPEKGSKRSKKTEHAQAEAPKRSLRPRKPSQQQLIQELELSLTDEEQISDELEHDENVSAEESSIKEGDISDEISENGEEMTSEYEYEVQPVVRDFGYEELSVVKGTECEEQLLFSNDGVYEAKPLYEALHCEELAGDSDDGEEQFAAINDEFEEQPAAKKSKICLYENSPLETSTSLPVLDLMDPGFFDL